MPLIRVPYKRKRMRRRRRLFKTRKIGWRQPVPNSDPFPLRVRTTVKYSTTFTTGSISAGVQAYYFRANGLFSPEASGGHQPLGFDQYMGIYTRYRVNACKITVDALNTSSLLSNSAPMQVVIHDSRTTVTAISIDGAIERPRSVNGTMDNEGKVVRISKYMRTKTAIGKEVLDDANFSGTSLTDPSTLWYWHLVVGNMDALDTTTAGVTVTLLYYVDFYDRKALAQS